MRQLSVVRAVAADPRLRRLEAAYLLFALTEYATWLAVTVWAYQRGGAREAGVAAFVQLVPAGLVAPVAATAGDRVRRDRMLAAGMATVAAACALTGAAMLAGAAAPAVYAPAALAAASMTVARPAIGAILPAVTDDPSALTAANVCVGLIDNLGIFAGPAVAGALLLEASPGVVFVVFAVAVSCSAGLVLSIRYEAARVRPTGGADDARFADELVDSLRRVAGSSTLRAPVTMVAAGYVVGGALDVFFVAVAVDLLAGDEALAGALGAASGVGGLVGAVASIALIGAARLRPAITVAALVAGVPLAAIAGLPTLAVAVAAMAAAGAGLSMLEVACRTLVQRSSADDVLVRVLGVMEAGLQFGVAIGALGAGLVTEAIGLSWALVVTAALLPVALVVGARALGRADEAATTADPALVRLLQAMPIFAPLGPTAIEQVAINLRPVRAEPGDAIVREGDDGDRYYVVVEGSVQVRQGARMVRRMGPGDGFGEVALIRSVPRTATVEAVEPSSLLALGRSVFLEAVTGQRQALATAERVTDRWLDADEQASS